MIAGVLLMGALVGAGAQDSVSTSGAGPTDTTAVALFVVREDRVAGDTLYEILPLAVGVGDDFQPVPAWTTARVGNASLRGDGFLDRFDRWAVVRDGVRIGSMLIDEVVVEHYDCNELFVGRGHATLEEAHPAPSPVSMERRGYVEGEELSYRLTLFAALGEDSPATGTQERSAPLDPALSEDDRRLVSRVAAEMLEEGYDGRAPAGRRGGSPPDPAADTAGTRIESLTSYDFEGDGVLEHLAVAAREDEAGRRSLALSGRIRDGEWVSLLADTRTNSPGAWGEGHRLLDVLDLDGDAVPELLFEVGGWEATAFEIWAYRGDRFERVFSHVAFGC